MKRLQEAPALGLGGVRRGPSPDGLREGGKVTKTENYRLSEMLKDHCRDLVLLSATPHQGDHFRFWMLIQLLNPTLFKAPEDMVENRHRLNSVVYRRTKADACRPDGSTLFARRWVHTESFVMSEAEREFYSALQVYLMDGFALAKQQGNKGRALGFVMTIFQKIAASSFAAVHRTLRRRLIALTVQEGLMHDTKLDIDPRDAAFAEAKELIRHEFGLGEDRMARVEAERVLADLKRRLLKKMSEEELALASSEYSSETVTTQSEDAAITPWNWPCPRSGSGFENCWRSFPNRRRRRLRSSFTPWERFGDKTQMSGLSSSPPTSAASRCSGRKLKRHTPAREWSSSRAAITAARLLRRNDSSSPMARGS